MKILIIRMFPDELNINTYNCQELGLAKALLDKGNQCDIVLYAQKNEGEEDIRIDSNKKIHIYHLKGRKFLNNVFFGNKLINIAKKYDIVQTSEYDQIANIRLKHILKNKLVIYHGPYASKYTRGYNVKCILSDLIMLFNKEYKKTKCITKSHLATEFLEKKGFKDIRTVGVGLDLSRIEKEQSDDREDFSNNDGKKYLLYIGKLEDRRNILFMIELLSKLNKNISLIIVGDGEEQYKEKIKQKISEYKLEDRVIYYKKLLQSELKKLYQQSEIFILPTKYEIFGMVLLEAMYFRNIVVSSYNGGSSTLIKDAENGYIMNDFCIDNWKNKIEEIMKQDNDNLKDNAKKTIIEKFTWEKIVNQFLKVYKDAYNEE